MNKQLILIALVAACSKKSGDPAASSAASVTQADADAVNALVPAELKDKVQFEVTKIEDDFGKRKSTYTLAAPKGWKKGFMPGSLEPADADNFGSKTLGKTTIQVGTNCDGACEKKDWAAVVEKVYYKQFTSGEVPGKVIKDEKHPSDAKASRTLVFQQEPKESEQGTTTVTSGTKGIRVVHTWWTEGASRVNVCMVELGEPAMGLAAAFEKTCSKVAISGD